MYAQSRQGSYSKARISRLVRRICTKILLVHIIAYIERTSVCTAVLSGSFDREDSAYAFSLFHLVIDLCFTV